MTHYSKSLHYFLAILYLHKIFILDKVMQYLISSMGNGSDSSSDVILCCSNGALTTHKLVLASLSKMFYCIFKQDSWDESITVFLPDITEEQLHSFFYDLYQGCNMGNYSEIF